MWKKKSEKGSQRLAQAKRKQKNGRFLEKKKNLGKGNLPCEKGGGGEQMGETGGLAEGSWEGGRGHEDMRGMGGMGGMGEKVYEEGMPI